MAGCVLYYKELCDITEGDLRAFFKNKKPPTLSEVLTSKHRFSSQKILGCIFLGSSPDESQYSKRKGVYQPDQIFPFLEHHI